MSMGHGHKEIYNVNWYSFGLVLTIFNVGRIGHLSESSIRPSDYLVRLWNHARIRSWNQPVISNKGKISSSRKQRGPLMGLGPTTSTLRVRRAAHWNQSSIRPSIYFSAIVKSRSNPFLESTSTKQWDYSTHWERRK